ncbi:MAG: hypothetical protein ACKVQS_08255 [Fimbriimonadaceae bacterium]
MYSFLSNGNVIISCLGNVSLPGLCESGGSVLVSNTMQILATGSVTASGSTALISISGNFNGINCEMVATSFANEQNPWPSVNDDSNPNSFDLPRGTLISALADAKILSQNTARISYIRPDIGRVIAEALGQGGYLGPKPIPHTSIGTPRVHRDGTHRSFPRTDDINGDGVADFDPAGGPFQIPGTPFLVDGRVIDSQNQDPALDYLVYIYGIDTNGDGQLHGAEILGIFGKCMFIPGINTTRYEVVDGVLYIIHENWNPNTGETLFYILNTQTGMLTVKNQNGQIVWGPGPVSQFGRAQGELMQNTHSMKVTK